MPERNCVLSHRLVRPARINFPLESFAASFQTLHSHLPFFRQENPLNKSALAWCVAFFICLSVLLVVLAKDKASTRASDLRIRSRDCSGSRFCRSHRKRAEHSGPTDNQNGEAQTREQPQLANQDAAKQPPIDPEQQRKEERIEAEDDQWYEQMKSDNPPSGCEFSSHVATPMVCSTFTVLKRLPNVFANGSSQEHLVVQVQAIDGEPGKGGLMIPDYDEKIRNGLEPAAVEIACANVCTDLIIGHTYRMRIADGVSKAGNPHKYFEEDKFIDGKWWALGDESWQILSFCFLGQCVN